MRTVLSLVAVFGAVASGSAQISGSSNGYDMKIKWSAGKRFDYLLETSIHSTNEKQPFSLQVPYSLSVLSVNGANATVKMNVGAIPGFSDKPIIQTVKIDNRGKVSSDKETISSMSLGSLPSKRVKIGQKWTSNVMIPSMWGSMASTATYELRKVANGVATVGVTVVSKNSATQMTGKGTMLLSAADGMIKNLSIKQNVKMKSQGKPANYTTNVQIRRK